MQNCTLWRSRIHFELDYFQAVGASVHEIKKSRWCCVVKFDAMRLFFYIEQYLYYNAFTEKNQDLILLYADLAVVYYKIMIISVGEELKNAFMVIRMACIVQQTRSDSTPSERPATENQYIMQPSKSESQLSVQVVGVYIYVWTKPEKICGHEDLKTNIRKSI